MPHPRTVPYARILAGFFFVTASFALASTAYPQPESAERTRSTMDHAIALLAKAIEHYRKVQDYECRIIKQERIHGKLLPEGSAIVKVRTNPLSIYLVCESPASERGVQACYVANQNGGKMRVHPKGLFGIIGFVSVNPRDPRAMEKSRHGIDEASFGSLLEATATAWEMERRLNKTYVDVADDVIQGRPCTRIVTVHPDREAGNFYGYRCVLWLDKETHLPAGAETYDWPHAGGQPGGDLLERFRFLDVRCNIGLSDHVFAH